MYQRFLLAVVLCVLGLVGGIKLSAASASSVDNNPNRCAVNQTVSYSCYQNELRAIVDQQNPKAAFDSLKIHYPKNPYIRSRCHQLTHVIGRAAYHKYASLVDTFGQADNYCGAGYYHGVIEELSKQKGEQYLINNLNNICSPVASAANMYIYRYCVHGLGHGLMETLNHDISASAAACDQLDSINKRHVCYEGAFMQLLIDEEEVQGDSAIYPAHPDSKDPMYPCVALADKYKPICYFLQVPFRLPIDNYDFAKVYGACAENFDIFANICYKLYGLNGNSKDATLNNNRLTKAICLPGPTFESRDYCIRGVVEVLLLSNRQSRAAQLCDSLEPKLKSNCLDYLKSYSARISSE